MHKDLISEAFEKAKKKRINDGKKKPSLINIAEDLSDYVQEVSNFRLGERSYRDYRQDALKLPDDENDIDIKQIKVINGLCKYLGFNDYPDFVSSKENIVDGIKLKNQTESEIKVADKNAEKNISQPSSSKTPWFKILTTISVSLGCAVILYLYLNKPSFMVWNENHYIEVEFDANKYELGELKLYKKERILNFKRIIPECRSTIFFNDDKTANLWYGKNSKGDIEYFTSIGKHPETGKTLKAITKYIVEKYICLD